MALQVQKEIISTLNKCDGDLRRFTSCLDMAKTDTSVEQTSPCMEELHALNDKLRQHRDQVRKWMTTGGSQHVKKNRLADTRQRIECEMRKFQEFDGAISTRSPSTRSPSVDFTESVGSESVSGNEVIDAEVKVTVDQVIGKSDLVEEFTCKICLVHVVGCEPQLTKCSHLFCGDCMSQWFAMNPGNKTWAQRAQGGGSVPCPVCKEPLHKDQDLNPVCCDGEGGSKMLFRMLSDTRIVCANNPKCDANGNCNWTGDYGSYQEHIRTCKNLPLSDLAPASPTQQATALPDEIDVPEVWDDSVESEPASPDPEVVDAMEAPFADVAPADDVQETQMDSVNTLVVVGVGLSAGLIGSLLECNPSGEDIKILEIEGEDACSTDASDRFGSFETSDPESEKEVAVSSDGDSEELPVWPTEKDFYAQAPAGHGPQPKSDVSPSSKRRQAKRAAAEKAKLAQGAKFVQAAQAKAAQAQALQFQAAAAAQYQAAYHQRAAQFQMAQFQAARLAQWQAQVGQRAAYAMQGAQVAHAMQGAQVAQMRAQQAMHVQRARAAKQ